MLRVLLDDDDDVVEDDVIWISYLTRRSREGLDSSMVRVMGSPSIPLKSMVDLGTSEGKFRYK